MCVWLTIRGQRAAYVSLSTPSVPWANQGTGDSNDEFSHTHTTSHVIATTNKKNARIPFTCQCFALSVALRWLQRLLSDQLMNSAKWIALTTYESHISHWGVSTASHHHCQCFKEIFTNTASWMRFLINWTGKQLGKEIHQRHRYAPQVTSNANVQQQ